MAFRERKRWVFLGLPFTFTVYSVNEETVTVNQGFLNKVENDCYMYKIQDVTLKSSLFERMFGLGTIVCYTGDTTSPELVIQHVKNSKEIKQYIFEQSEVARRKRRTMATLDIGADTEEIQAIDVPDDL
ncbi:MAG: PH domain-containing protein [Lachnospiraceae bacterium]|nr:PH domain-containing protein [Lachnospiraceae bacterium]